MRRASGCPVPPTDDQGREIEFRGRIVSYTCFANASTRKSGEAIVSLAEASSRGDRLVRLLLPRSDLALESIQRHRESGAESIYYEARYASGSGEIPFLEAPVRLLLNASTGELFRFDVDADWLDPAGPPRVAISRKSAERIATVVLRGRDFAPAFGPGAVFEKVAAAEMFTVHPNDWLGFFTESGEARARVAWVVPFRVGGAAAGLHRLFVDAATGRVIGGLPDQPPVQPPR